MEYRTVFDIATSGFKGWYFAASAYGLLVLAVGSILYIRRKDIAGQWPSHQKARIVFVAFIFGFFVISMSMGFFSTYRDYSSLLEARRANNLKIVEGIVTDFKPMPASGHANEKFCVSDVCFQYSDFATSPGFNNTSSHGGPIREGLPVRVSYIGNDIAKLEVAK